jgi:hypothetical protein
MGRNVSACHSVAAWLPLRDFRSIRVPDCVSPEFLLIVEQLLAQMLGLKNEDNGRMWIGK